MSETQTLLEALLTFQEKAPTLQRDATNPHFNNRYVSLDGLTQAITPVLTTCHLVWTTMPCRDRSGAPALHYELAHVPSKEKLEGTMPLMLAKDDPQGQGSALTYARRYAISAVLGLSAEDDDGNAASVVMDTAESVQCDREAAPQIPLDRAKAILKLAKEARLASENKNGTVTLKPVLKAKLASVGVSQITRLNVDQAEDVETWLRAEAKS